MLSFQFLLLVGASSVGGGSGGRIGVYLSKPFDFRGAITAVGGAGSSPGGPGTTYIEISDGALIKRMLKIDGMNRGGSSGLKVFLDESGGYYHPLDIVQLTRQAMLSVKEVSARDNDKFIKTYKDTKTRHSTRSAFGLLNLVELSRVTGCLI